jgi:hypothetical protein
LKFLILLNVIVFCFFVNFFFLRYAHDTSSAQCSELSELGSKLRDGVTRNFRNEILQGTPDEMEMEMESTDPDLVEPELESEGSSHDDTTDSVVSFFLNPNFVIFKKFENVILVAVLKGAAY